MSRLVVGVDEAGRGPLAGPVVAAAVILDPEQPVAGLADSKALDANERERLALLLQERALAWCVAVASPAEIDAINILQATHRGMNEALGQLKPKPEHALVDGTRVKTLNWHQTPLVKGDSLSYSIAAASVLAKVTRDRILVEAHRQWPQYGFEQHKGYPTREHLEALALHGPCPIHRRSFAPLKPQEPELLLNLD